MGSSKMSSNGPGTPETLNVKVEDMESAELLEEKEGTGLVEGSEVVVAVSEIGSGSDGSAINDCKEPANIRSS